MREIATPPAVIRAAETLDELALVINSTHAAAEEASRKGLERYREVGLMLTAAKKKCGHGQWLPWLKANVKFSERQARNYMQLAKSAVTADLGQQWRAILGNAPDEDDEPEPTEDPPAPAPKAAPAPPKPTASTPAPAPVAPKPPAEPEPEEAEEAEEEADEPDGGDEPAAEPEEPEAAPETVVIPPTAVDAWGIPVQPHAAEAFAHGPPKARELLKLLQQAQRLFNEYATGPGGEFVRLPSASSYRRGRRNGDDYADRYVHTGLEQCVQHVKASIAKYTVCPYEFAEGGHPDDCRTCLNLKWTPELSPSVPPVCIDRAKAAFGAADKEAA